MRIIKYNGMMPYKFSIYKFQIDLLLRGASKFNCRRGRLFASLHVQEDVFVARLNCTHNWVLDEALVQSLHGQLPDMQIKCLRLYESQRQMCGLWMLINTYSDN